MKHKLFLLLWLVIFILPVSASAHAGDTDSNGGHYDHETGEYHYHHGYPAHSHYDIDGDGYRDCPYNFDDQTGANSGSSSGSSSSSGTNIAHQSYSDGYADGYDAGYQIGASKNYQNGYDDGLKKVPAWASWIIAILSVSVAVLAIMIRAKNRNLVNQKSNFDQRSVLEQNRVKSGMAELHFSLVKKFGNRYLYIMSGAPGSAFVDENLLPHSSGSAPGSLEDDYTYYLGVIPGNSRAKYHHRSCRYAKHIYPINIYNARNNSSYTPCSICPCGYPDTSWVDTYRKHHAFLSKYVQIDHGETVKMQSDLNAKYPGFPDKPGIKINWRDQ